MIHTRRYLYWWIKMSRKWGKFDYKQFEKLAKQFDDVEKLSEQMMIEILVEAANRVLRKTKKNTPVIIGDLRRNWYVSDVKKKGNGLEIEIYNAKEYAVFVENGHRQEVGRYVPAIGKKLKKPWVEGKYMLSTSMKEVEALLPKIADEHSRELIKGLFK